MAVKLKAAGLTPVPVDTIETSPLQDWSEVDRTLERLGSFDWVVFTSAKGVEFFAARMKALHRKLPWAGRPHVAAVGDRTATSLSRLGTTPEFVPSRYLTEALGEELPVGRGMRVLLLRADIANPGLSKRLAERGFEVTETPIYRTTVARKGARRSIANANLVIFASPSAVRGFCEVVAPDELERAKRLPTICIGPVTAKAAKANGFTDFIIPPKFTLDSVLAEIVRLNQGRA